MLYIGKAPKGKFPHTWQLWDIKIPKPPYISSLKIIGFLHFLHFWDPSEKDYNLQSFLQYNYKSQCSQVIILPLYIRSKIVRHCCFAAVFIVIFAQLLLLSACNIEPLAHPGSLRLTIALRICLRGHYLAPRLSTGRLPSQIDILATFKLLRLF